MSGQPIQTGIYGNAIANNTIGGLFNSPSSTNVHSAFQASYNGTGAAMYANNNHPSQGAAGQFVNTFVGATTPGNRGGALLAENRAALFNPSLYENGSLTQPRYDPNNDSSKWAYAAEFQGDVKINGFINGNHPASAPMKMFLIDHPLDPANKTLMHSVVESPDVKNIYDGVVTTDKSGDAVVQLPDYFEALNRDYRYQLTCLGQFAQAIVSKKVANNQFQIQTDEPNVEVSWQITGIRQDAYVKAHPFEPEKIKSEADRGKYLYPREAGVDPKLEIGYDPDAQARRAAVQVNLDLSSPGVAAANPTGGVVLQSTSAPTPSGKRPSPRIPSNGSRTTRR